MFRNWCLCICPAFDTCYVFINPVSKWSTCFTYVKFPTFGTFNQVNDVTDFTSEVYKFGKVHALILSTSVVTSEVPYFVKFRAISTFP